MGENKIFSFALVLSLLLHILALIQFSYNRSHYVREGVPQSEITYQPVKVTKADNQTRRSSLKDSPSSSNLKSKALADKKINLGNKVFFNSSLASPFMKDLDKSSEKISVNKNQMVTLDSRSTNRQVTLPTIKSDKIDNPVYLHYYEIIRDKVKDRAYLNYAGTDTGEVYLTFVLTSDGSLKEIRLIEEKTSASKYLKNISLKSIRDSCPFPSFLHDLKYPELSFSVLIKFEAKN